MADSINIGNITVDKFYLGSSDNVQIYLGSTKLYPNAPTFDVCYAVVSDISLYQDREFDNVYDKETEKWYKLNNLNQYEEYGIYGSGRTITTYEGKLTIDDGYEYEWNGSSWVNVGEVSGSSRVPSEYVELTHVQTIKQDVSNASAFTVPIDIQSSYNYIIEFMPLDWSNQSYYGDVLGNDGDTNFPSYGLFKLNNGWGTEWRRTVASFWNYSFDTRSGKPADSKYRFYDNTKARVTMHLHNYDAEQGADMIVENEGYPTSAVTSTSAQKSGYVVSTGVYNSPLFCTQSNNMRMTAYMNFYNLKIETNENVAVYDYIPCKRKSDNKVGLYDVVHNVFHAPLFQLNAGDEASHTEYPKYYSEKSEPLDDLTFNTLAEAQAYAKANCVYDGMKATIDGGLYVFDSTDENGWVEDTSYTIWLDPSATNASFSIGHYWGENYKIVFTTYLSGAYSGDYGSFWQANGHTPIELSFYSNGFYYDMHNPTSTTAPNVNTTDYDFRILRQNAFSNYENSQKIKITLTYGSFKAELADSGTLIYSSGSTKTGYSWYSGLYQVNIGLNNDNAKCHLSHIQVYNANNELVNDFKFIKNNGVVGSQEISIYDSVTNTTYNNTNSNTPVYHIET